MKVRKHSRWSLWTFSERSRPEKALPHRATDFTTVNNTAEVRIEVGERQVVSPRTKPPSRHPPPGPPPASRGSPQPASPPVNQGQSASRSRAPNLRTRSR
ncbi:hypothetical protein NUW54_g13358 [Trametes sanguinea]|uniref:Uncharacterized protein n=1 Tax=Trametes sanguinea TaxID=158606 RepID=A0ACC1MMQ8_9APHY|nr:hypothetical protein NUW54_g13358 [Trametes sanguinea]